jgi:hypothetical protein
LFLKIKNSFDSFPLHEFNLKKKTNLGMYLIMFVTR